MNSPQVTRPAIPLVAWCVLGLFGGILIAEELSWRYATAAGGLAPARLAAGALFAGAAGALGILLALRPLSDTARSSCTGSPAVLLAVVLLCACIGCGVGSVRWHGWHTARDTLAESSAQHVSRQDAAAGTRMFVVRDPVKGRFGWTTIVRPADSPAVRIRVMLPDDHAPPRLGEIIAITDRIGPVATTQEWSRRAHRRVEAGSVAARSAQVHGWADTPSGLAGPVRAAVNERIAEVPGVGGDLLQGVLLGDRTRLMGTPAEEDLRVAGLSHLVAVSGSHLVIVALMVARVVASARGGLTVRIAFVAVAMLAYVVISGVQPSALRALGMGLVAGLAALSGRRGDGLAALAVAAGVMLVADPAVAFDIGFRLSVAAVVGLVLFASLASAWVRGVFARERVARRMRPLTDMLAVTVVAQAATAPVAIPAFQAFSLIAPVANMIAIPLVTLALALGLGAAIIGLVFEPLAVPLLTIAALPLWLVAEVSRWMALLPGAAPGVEISAAVLAALALLPAIVLWAVWPLPRGRWGPRVAVGGLIAATVLGITGLPARGSDPLLTVLDVGQGDAVLVRDGGSTLLIDTGPDPDVLRVALTRAGVREIDALLFTHDHADHTGGAAGLVGVARVQRALGPVVADPEAFAHLSPLLGRLVRSPSPSEPILRPVSAGDVLTVGRTRLEVLWPRAPDPLLEPNDTSVVLHLTRGAFSAILSGDAEEIVWDTLGRDDAIPDIDVALVPHHGSANGLTAEALDAWSPQVAIVSAGAGNDFGHPSPETIALLADRGVTVLRTDLHGDIRVYGDDTGETRVRFDRRGERLLSCATISQSTVGTFTELREHGRINPCGPQARLPDPRQRRPAARPGRGPPQETAFSEG